MRTSLRSLMLGCAAAVLWTATPTAGAGAATFAKPAFGAHSLAHVVNHRHRGYGYGYAYGGRGWRDDGYYPSYRWHRSYYRGYRGYDDGYYPDAVYDRGYGYGYGRGVVVDAPFAHVYVGPYGRHIVAPFVNLWVP